MRSFWLWTTKRRPTWRESRTEAAVAFAVFGATGSTSLAVVRPALKAAGFEGSLWEARAHAHSACAPYGPRHRACACAAQGTAQCAVCPGRPALSSCPSFPTPPPPPPPRAGAQQLSRSKRAHRQPVLRLHARHHGDARRTASLFCEHVLAHPGPVRPVCRQNPLPARSSGAARRGEVVAIDVNACVCSCGRENANPSPHAVYARAASGTCRAALYSIRRRTRRALGQSSKTRLETRQRRARRQPAAVSSHELSPAASPSARPSDPPHSTPLLARTITCARPTTVRS